MDSHEDADMDSMPIEVTEVEKTLNVTETKESCENTKIRNSEI